jgi:hypothetical protein
MVPEPSDGSKIAAICEVSAESGLDDELVEQEVWLRRMSVVERHLLVCEHMFVPAIHYSVTEYDPARPWVVVGQHRRLTIDLEEGEDFVVWAAEHWPAPRYRVEPETELPAWPY